MNINIKAVGFDLTPSFRQFIEEKLGSLAKFVERFDAEGAVGLWFEISRSAHHKKGDVFCVEAGIKLPGQVLRAKEEGGDARVAVDRLKHTLHLEIEKYKTRNSPRG